jgi:hypothetical protein
VRNLNVKVIIQPSLNDLTQEPIYPVLPFQPTAQFLKQNNVKNIAVVNCHKINFSLLFKSFYFTSEPNIIKINGYRFAVTSTDIIKDLSILSTSK